MIEREGMAVDGGEKQAKSLNYFNWFVKKQVKSKENLHAYLISVDFDNFNYINDLFGYDMGDRVLAELIAYYSRCVGERETFIRIHADHFAFYLEAAHRAEVISRLHTMMNTESVLSDILTQHYKLVCSGGLIELTDNEETMPALFDKTNYARKRAKGNNSNTFLCYDEKLKEELEWRKMITLTMECALQNGEFEMYLQPKVLITTGEVVGAEALVRWNSKKNGMIYPDRFISILEQNGFVREMDFYILEEACRFLKESRANGIRLLPISVNFSRVHIRSGNFVERVFETVKRSGISANLIEIEITENLLFDDFDGLMDVVRDLKHLGFCVSLDDFGSAYSSLNHLKDLPLDIIKIDRKFLDSSTDTDKGRIIVAKVVELVKSLQMVCVMEGVETMEQVDFLKNLGCDLGQGYFYAKPMPKEHYIAFLKANHNAIDYEAALNGKMTEEISTYDEIQPQELQIDNWELYILGQNINLGLLKSNFRKDYRVSYINERALEYLGYSRQEFRKELSSSLLSFVSPIDRDIFDEHIKGLLQTGTATEFKTRALRRDGKEILLCWHASMVVNKNGEMIGIYALRDVTKENARLEHLQTSLEMKIAELEKAVQAERESRNAHLLSEERYRLIVEQSDDIMFEWDFKTDRVHFSEKYKEIFGRETLDEPFSTSSAICSRVHPDDVGAFRHWVESSFRQYAKTELEMRVQKADDDYLWIRCRSTPFINKDGELTGAVGVFTDIHKQKIEMDRLTHESQRDSLTKLFNRAETECRVKELISLQEEKAGALFIIDIDNFKGVNDNLGHQLGDRVLSEMAEKISGTFRETDIVGRIGGDEIAVFARGLQKESDIFEKAMRLNVAMRSTYYGDNRKYDISGSIGIALFPTDGKTFEELYHLADIALYQSKYSGKNRFTLYQKDMRGESNVLTPLEWSEQFLNRYFENDFTYNVFEMLYETKDLQATMEMILKLTGTHFGADRVYIFQTSEDGKKLSNTYEWCAEGVSAEKNSLQNLTITALDPYICNFNREGILYCNDISRMDASTYKTLARQGIQSFLQGAFYDAGVFNGFIGLDECKNQREWSGEEIATLGYLSRILSVFLKK